MHTKIFLLTQIQHKLVKQISVEFQERWFKTKIIEMNKTLWEKKIVFILFLFFNQIWERFGKNLRDFL
ncbi:MAG: hypothetical protein ACP6IU_11320 [Candidatus Asgardarchaeia archaeon]